MSQFLEQAISTFSDTKVEWSTLAIGLCSGSVLGGLLRLHFIKLSSSFGGDRRSFGNNLVFITLTTLLIITTIKSSLALSLGLVGALSIVRFRTPIKFHFEWASSCNHRNSHSCSRFSARPWQGASGSYGKRAPHVHSHS